MSESRNGGPASRDEAAMADILASIRRIVADGDPAQRAAVEKAGEVLVLTEAMRLDQVSEAPAPKAEPLAPPPEPPAPPPVDDVRMAETARAVLHQEFKGDFGKMLTRNLRLLVREEIAKALNERRGDSG